jgi:hypothetical protein
VSERGKLLLLAAAFAAIYFLPVERPRVQGAFLEGLWLLKDYARQHVLLCLVPALFIAGAIGEFVRQGAVLRYLGPRAPRPMAYGVASLSGSVLAVCSCTVLPLFAGIYRRGAGLGPATAFLYSGPAVNVLAVILTARVLGLELGAARAVGAVSFALLVGLAMAWLFRREEAGREQPGPDPFLRGEEAGRRRPWQDAAFLATMVAILVLANWGAPGAGAGFFAAVHRVHWHLAAALLLALAAMMVRWYERHELRAWVESSWGFGKQIVPLLFAGVLVSGWLLGRPGVDAGLVPSRWVEGAVGGNGVGANAMAAVIGALMYFATLTEIPVLQALLGAGMGRGPGLTLLLAGPALSLPSMLVIHSILGLRKTAAYIGLVVVMSAVTGWLYGALGGG